VSARGLSEADLSDVLDDLTDDLILIELALLDTDASVSAVAARAIMRARDRLETARRERGVFVDLDAPIALVPAAGPTEKPNDSDVRATVARRKARKPAASKRRKAA